MSRYGVYFIPPGNDIVDSETLKKRAGYRSPFRLFGEDVMLLMKNWRLSLNVILPIISPDPLPGVKPESGLITRDYCLMAVLLAIELPALIAVIPAYLLLPGWVFMAGLGSLYALIWILSRTMWGDIVVDSQAKLPLDAKKLKQYEHEKWIFINGISTSRNMMERSCSAISATFKRPVTGIHNRSWGLIGDLIECLIQRSFNYETEDVRVAYECLKSHLEDEGVRKIVVIAHSQGGILISLVLDRLYASMPAALLAKMEVYTFGSAAAHFRNPLLTHPTLGQSATPTPSTASTTPPSSATFPPPSNAPSNTSRRPPALSTNINGTATPSPAPQPSSQPNDQARPTSSHSHPPPPTDLARTKSATFPLPSYPLHLPLTTASLDSNHPHTTSHPLTTLQPSDPRLPTHTLPHIEHYVNSLDLVPRWGVLYHIVLSLGTHYSGSVFVHEGASGHLFDAHYLSTMFPLSKLDAIRRGGHDSDAAGAGAAGPYGYGGKLFLNHTVQLSSTTRHDRSKIQQLEAEEEAGNSDDSPEVIVRRKERTMEKAARLEKSGKVWRARTWGRGGSFEEFGGEGEEGGDGEVGGDAGTGGAGERHAKGPVFTVKELSRLWRYMDGGMA
ncbi:MAG: hypothetical protein M1828_003091 [Chrysothrix sp. TS-e1954]|nr:MAG: hypothetical protein M1828_003091 [Chrysothrix sp. TS-e1954]